VVSGPRTPSGQSGCRDGPIVGAPSRWKEGRRVKGSTRDANEQTFGKAREQMESGSPSSSEARQNHFGGKAEVTEPGRRLEAGRTSTGHQVLRDLIHASPLGFEACDGSRGADPDPTSAEKEREQSRTRHSLEHQNCDVFG